MEFTQQQWLDLGGIFPEKRVQVGDIQFAISNGASCDLIHPTNRDKIIIVCQGAFIYQAGCTVRCKFQHFLNCRQPGKRELSSGITS